MNNRLGTDPDALIASGKKYREQSDAIIDGEIKQAFSVRKRFVGVSNMLSVCADQSWWQGEQVRLVSGRHHRARRLAIDNGQQAGRAQQSARAEVHAETCLLLIRECVRRDMSAVVYAEPEMANSESMWKVMVAVVTCVQWPIERSNTRTADTALSVRLKYTNTASQHCRRCLQRVAALTSIRARVACTAAPTC